MHERVGRLVADIANPQIGSDALAQVGIYHTDGIFTVERGEAVLFCEGHEFFANHGLVGDEGFVEIVGEMQVAAGFPETDGWRLLKFAFEGNLRAHVEKKSEVWRQREIVDAMKISVIESANGGADDECVVVAVGKDNHSG